jgi:cell division protein FtsN
MWMNTVSHSADRSRRLLGLAVIVAICAALAGFLIYGVISNWNARPTSSAATTAPEAAAPFAPDVQADAEPAPTPPSAKRSVPEVLPDFTLVNREGNRPSFHRSQAVRC